MLNSTSSTTFQLVRRKRIVPKSDSDSDNVPNQQIMNNRPTSNCDLSQLSSSSHLSLNHLDDSGLAMSPEVLRYANSVSFPPIMLTGTPHFTAQSSSAIVQFLRSLLDTHPSLSGVRDISWRLNNQHQLLLFAPNRDVFSLLITHKYPSVIGTSSVQIILPRRLPPQLSLLLLHVPCCLDDPYLLTEIQKQFPSVKALHRIRTTSLTNNTTLVRLDFERADECDNCLHAKFLSVANVRLPVKQYLGPPRIPQCPKCCQFGHFANKCRSSHKICGHCAHSIFPDTVHQCGSSLCINCSHHPLYSSSASHGAFDPRCPSMIHYKKILVCKLVDEGIISNHLYVPKELQHRLKQVRERLQQANVLSSFPSPHIPSPSNPWTIATAPSPPVSSPAVVTSYSSSSASSFMDFIQTTVQPFNDQLSNISKQMSNLTVLSVIHEHKVDYVSSLVEKIVLPSFQLMTETFPALISLLPDSFMVNRDELRNKLQQTSLLLQKAQDQHASFMNSMRNTRHLMIDANIMTLFADRPLPVLSAAVDPATTHSSLNQ